MSNTIRGAVANWSKTLSVELAPFGITVNNVLPGASMTGRLEALIRDRSEKQKKTMDEVIQEMVAEIPREEYPLRQKLPPPLLFFRHRQPDTSMGSICP